MNIPLSWLKEAAKIEDATPNLLQKMTASGNAVESLTVLGEDITGVVVGKIVSLERHPDADKLWVTQVAIKSVSDASRRKHSQALPDGAAGLGAEPHLDEVLQIVTGADNLKVGDYIPVAVHGSTLANGIKIKKGKMRGLDSNGMLCSIDELGYTVADYPEAPPEGIYVFQEPQTLGADVRPIMQLCEEVAEFDILSNRPDTNSVMGMAREAAAVYGKEFTLPQISVNETASGLASDIVTVEIKDSARCPRYIARVIRNVQIGPSPQWLRRRLSTAGVRPINNIVDITNYVMLEYGQPLHAFDISAVAQKDGKHGIVVRTAKAGEKFTTLDGEERELTDTTLLIADHEKPIGIAGVMGGENSKILDTTTTILFESANFDSANIRQTSRALGMRTDASARYEKGQDPNQALTSVNRAMELVQLLGCGDVVPGMVDSYPAPRAEKTVQFKPCGICALLGIEAGDNGLGPVQICEYLQRVGIATKMHETYIDATIPTFRADITAEADLAEEVARFYGLNNIESRYQQLLSGTPLPSNKAGKTPRRRRQDKLKHVVTALGYYEALTYPFESPRVFDKLNIPQGHPITAGVKLKNPLGEDFSIMRTLPFGGLLESLSRNYNKGNENVSLFEIACTYTGKQELAERLEQLLGENNPTSDASDGETRVTESPYLALVSYGKDVDYLSFKGDIESLLATVTNRPNVFKPHVGFHFMHPGRTATISVKTSPNPRDEATLLGVFGELHPAVAKNYDIGTRVYVAWIDMDAIHQVAEAYKFKFTNPAVYPALSRDIAFTVNSAVPAADLEAAIKEKGGQLLSEVVLFDVYQGAQVGEGYKSMAYALKFRANDRTLTVPEVQKSLDAILSNLQKKFEAEVRA